MQFSDKILLVTGGTQGIGLAVAIAAARGGARVVVCGRSAERARDALAQAASSGAELDFIACDVADSASVDALFATLMDRYGRLDMAFNNAGITAQHAMLGEADSADWRRVIDINLIGTYLCMRHEINCMGSRGGVIVNTSSAAGVMAIGGQSAYVASKAAIIGLTQSAAIDYADASRGAQIRVNAIAPGPIEGGMNDAASLARHPARTARKLASTAMRRFGSADEVAHTVLWLLSDAASYITGAVIPVDGGYAAGKF